MTVGQIQRNYIQQNSVGVGFFGYSGFSGFSGQTGVIGLPGGAFLWIDDILVFDSLNGFYVYNGGTYWSPRGISDWNTGTGPTANWKDGVAIPGFVTKVRARAVLGPRQNGTSGNFWAMRIRQVLAMSNFSPQTNYFNPDWSTGYETANMLVIKTGGSVMPYNEFANNIVYGPLVGAAVSAVWTSHTQYSEYKDPPGTWVTVTGNLAASGLETPWVNLPGDGDYMVEVFANGGWIPDKVFVEFAKVKT